MGFFKDMQDKAKQMGDKAAQSAKDMQQKAQVKAKEMQGKVGSMAAEAKTKVSDIRKGEPSELQNPDLVKTGTPVSGDLPKMEVPPPVTKGGPTNPSIEDVEAVNPPDNMLKDVDKVKQEATQKLDEASKKAKEKMDEASRKAKEGLKNISDKFKWGKK